MMDQEPAPAPAAPGVLPAGFWRRVAASIIDGIIITGRRLPRRFLPVARSARGCERRLRGRRRAPGDRELYADHDRRGRRRRRAWAYWAFQESGPAQATLGKRALGLRVTGLDGARVSLLTASYRCWTYWLPVPFVLIEFLYFAAVAVAFIGLPIRPLHPPQAGPARHDGALLGGAPPAPCRMKRGGTGALAPAGLLRHDRAPSGGETN